MTASVETRQKISDSLRAYYASPEVRATHCGIMRDRGPIEKTCDWCGETFETRGYNTKRCPAHRDQAFRETSLRRKFRNYYGLAWEAYVSHLELIGDKCEICGDLGATQRHGRLTVDHDHSTMMARGLLCDSCNLVLGKMQDKPELLRAAALYLERPNPFFGPAAAEAQ